MFTELHCKSHYSFLTGASSPEELVYQAHALGYKAIAITDECSYAGIVKAYKASEECGIKLIIGSEFLIEANNSLIKLLLIAPNRTAYSEISQLISQGRRRSDKGQYSLHLRDLRFGLQACLALWLPQRQAMANETSRSQQLKDATTLASYFKYRLWIGVELNWQADDQQHYLHCQHLGETLGCNLVACNDVHMHARERKPLQDTLTAIRLNTTIDKLGKHRQQNAEKHLKSIKTLYRLYPPQLLQEANIIADLCHFSMDELRYEYPQELVPDGLTPPQYLRQLVQQGERKRWPQGTPQKVQKQLDYELQIIQELEYEYYFLTVYDIVAFARSQRILCQGRGSAANSAVCYCLFITEVDPSVNQLLFERFISKERNEPPDIDVDFESQQREQVIQYIYSKYSRRRTALAATVITYRRKSAVRDVGKALGLPLNFLDELNKSMAWWDKLDEFHKKLEAYQGTLKDQKTGNNLAQHFFSLVKQILGTPRHLSQHVGGFVITHSPTSNLVPIENAAMPDRTIIQWDKYDIEILGILKVDVLGLGMLSAIRRALEMINSYLINLRKISSNSAEVIDIQSIPREDPAVYDMLCQGDSVGVFQVESRAQMSMLPRLQPRCFYDLVIEVAIVRPGPIQGDMVHPFLKRRNGEEAISYPNAEIEAVLQRTLGVPIFQEQVIKLTMVAGGFSGGEADQLRRAMASWGKNGNLDKFHGKLINGMLNRGYDIDFAERLFKQIKGFGSYGFPESHAASFALLVYISSWLKRHHPAAFYAGILNSQPMGFYSPSQLVQDARKHKVTVLPVCILRSEWEHTLDYEVSDTPAIRLGLCLIKGVSEDAALRYIKARKESPPTSVKNLRQTGFFNAKELRKLSNANAMHLLDGNRRQAYWDTLDQSPFPTQMPAKQSSDHDHVTLPRMSPIQEMLADYQHARGVSLDHHPIHLLKDIPPINQCVKAESLIQLPHKSMVKIAGVVTGRQRPGTASGVLFMSLEDETGTINVVCWHSTQERFRTAILTGQLLYIRGTLELSDHPKQQADNGNGSLLAEAEGSAAARVIHVIAGYVEKIDHLLPQLNAKSRNFH